MGTNNLKFCLFLSCLSLLAFEGLAQPQIQPISSVQPLTTGQRVTLDCTVTNTNMNEDIEWYHDGDVVSFGQNLLRDREGAYTLQVTQEQGVPSTYHWIITIANANIIRDEGSWSCNFAPEGSVAQVVVTDLLVIGPPFVSFVTSNLNNPPLNSDVRLECVATGSPLPSVTWSRTYPVPYILVDGARKGFVRQISNNTIRLNPITMDHRGEYMCSVTNGHGEIQTRKAYVQLPYAPEVTATLKNIRVPENSEAVLACISQAYPATATESDVMWTLNGNAVDPSQGSNVDVDRHPDNFNDERYYSRLTIRSVNSNHVGTYECIFTNQQGIGSATVTLGMEPTIDPNFGAKNEL
ncbi:protein amalgam [Strongylocentrotus purpuratus]|uniref:Ig-like domain-containing protein n=1 Tax=Strongylocentrotus purpuratus TaxID=7668 RepID=A0A7M7SV72_STRPU|nr:protein amalgam [Strongylocentrotus purpuratus]